MTTQTSHEKPSEHRRILIVDDHPIMREGLAYLIDQEPDLLVCGEAEDAQQALQAVRTLHPDLALVDLMLKGGGGLHLIKNLHVEDAGLLILVVSMHDELLYASRVLRVGARGYIMKQEDPQVILDAIGQVLRGQVYISARARAGIVQGFIKAQPAAGDVSLAQLSDRELDVLNFLGLGYSPKQIAEALHLSVKTIWTHRDQIIKKLHLKKPAELVQYAMDWVYSLDTC